MLRLAIAWAIALVLYQSGWIRSQSQDIRQQFGTNNLEAAKQLAQAIELYKSKKPKEASVAVAAAIKADPKFQMAYFLKGNILSDLGEIPESMEAYKKSLSDDVVRSNRISAVAANNLAITLGKLKEYDESNVWFTRAILEDYNNSAGERGKAYRNLSVNLGQQGKNLAAGIAVALALQDKIPSANVKMMQNFFDKGQNQETACLLYFDDKVPTLKKRSRPTELSLVSTDDIPETITNLLADPQGRYLVALGNNAPHFYVLATSDKVSVTKVPVTGPIISACLAEGHLYVVSRDPFRLDKLSIEIASGTPPSSKVIETVSLGTQGPTSVAVFPSQSLAFYPAEGVLHGINLKTSRVFKTDIPGQVVVGHPNQRYVYSFVKPERRGGGGSGQIIINGRPIIFQSRVVNWLQTSLFEAAVTPGGLLLAAVRDNVASNAIGMGLSPDGNWIAVAGGGGWRPQGGQSGGYGVAVFSSVNMDHLQGFFATDAYPQGVCFSPALNLVTAIRGQDAKVYDLTDIKTPIELKGNFKGVGSWSGNARYLVLARNDKGVAVYENSLSDSEKRIAAEWWKSIRVIPMKSQAVASAAFKEIPRLRQFVVKNPSREELVQLLDQSFKEGRSDKPSRWQDFSDYTKDSKVKQEIADASENLKNPADLGIAIFQIKKSLKAHPDSVPLKFLLAETLRQANQPDDLDKLYTEIVREDAGKTDLTCSALNHLAQLSPKKDGDLAPLYCLALSLYADKASPQTLALAIPLLKNGKFEAEAERWGKLNAGQLTTTASGLPRLAKAEKDGKKSTTTELYKKAVWSVVFVETDKGTGSGVCVGKPDIILTNDHVVAGAEQSVSVYPFIYKDKGPVRMPKLRATILYQSSQEDIAVLKLDKAPDFLEPMPVAPANPMAGERVYAVGSPGLDDQVLEQSISEGLISSTSRKVGDKVLLQHSAAVNPGNSGGPLIDEAGHLVGIVTLKAKLENVSFAIPVETIRRIFNSQ
jgi:tetratricopeptide (TPR) repeat protein